MGVLPATEGFRVVWDVGPFDAAWVLVPALASLAAAALLLFLALRVPASPGRTGALSGAAGLWLLAAWWTLGGVGAWRAGVVRLSNGTANVAEGTLVVPSAEALQVADVSLRRPASDVLPPLHACRWPALQRFSGQHVRLFFFAEDVLRLEVEARPSPPPAP